MPGSSTSVPLEMGLGLDIFLKRLMDLHVAKAPIRNPMICVAIVDIL